MANNYLFSRLFFYSCVITITTVFDHMKQYGNKTSLEQSDSDVNVLLYTFLSR